MTKDIWWMLPSGTGKLQSEMAKEEGIELTEKHFEVLEFLRNANAKGETLTIRKVGKSGITDIKGLV